MGVKKQCHFSSESHFSSEKFESEFMSLEPCSLGIGPNKHADFLLLSPPLKGV